MRKVFGALFMLLALAMLSGAGWLIFENNAEETLAEKKAEQVMFSLTHKMQNSAAPAAVPDITPAPDANTIAVTPEMPVMEIDGHAYIGYLEMPAIGLKLPVMSDWSYPKLRIAPCRYWGSVYDDTLVIMAHNYERHFGQIASMEPGAPVQFVDADGNIYKYVVAKQEILQKQDVDKMVSREWDLTLFSCTYGGEKRVTVRLERVLAY